MQEIGDQCSMQLPFNAIIACSEGADLDALQKMNVEGLTRENVASHLQKYRLQLKREHE